MIDNNKNGPAMMWKTLKEIIRGKYAMKVNEIDIIDFEVVENIEDCNIADKFNSYYIQSINNIIKSIKEGIVNTDKNRKIVCVIRNKRIMEELQKLELKKLE